MITDEQLYELYTTQGVGIDDLASTYDLSYDQVRYRIRKVRDKVHIEANAQQSARLPVSPFPIYNQPLVVNGDALVLNDLEVPFHHAEFVNKCLDLADAWKVNQLILGGDIMHFETFSAWGAAWQSENPAVDTISEETEKRLRAFVESLPEDQREAYESELNALSLNRESNDDEIKSGAKALKVLESLFIDIYYVLGNHDDRFLRRLNSPLTPKKLLNFLGLVDACWHIAPYYKAILNSGGETWHVEHQRGTGVNVAIRLADKNESHTICAHNHFQAQNWSTSGRYYAISTGCACDELRMPYAAQRSTNQPAHKRGAVIVRDGYPYVLSERSPFDRLKRMR